METVKAPAQIGHVYRIEYVDPDPAKSWSEEFTNLVPDVALNKILDDTYKTKSADAAFAVGLIVGPGAAGVAAGDTMTSHTGWTESVVYSDAGRPAWTPGTVAAKSVSNSGSPAVFNVNTSGTVGGCFLVSGTAGTSAGQIGQKSGTGGTLRSCGAFSSGDKTVSNGGTLTVTITATAA
jgi:hypothetical protein